MPSGSEQTGNYDVVIIGGGVSGMYAVHHFREMGLSVRAYDGASDVGGTWWYNRYPGARVDGPGSPYYCFTFSDDLMEEWDWDETQSEGKDVLAYLEYVATKFDLRKDIQFETWVEDVEYDEATQRWTIGTNRGDRVTARFVICASGALSTQNMPNYEGIQDFAGEVYHTGNWPREEVSFEGKRVAVMGTGSSGIQAIPEIAKIADHVTVLQRTAQFAFPAGNRSLTEEDRQNARKAWEETKAMMVAHPGGFPHKGNELAALDFTEEERQAHFEKLWKIGSFHFFLNGYNDVATSEEANASMSNFVRGKIREIVKDPETADKLMPDHYVMTKRPILENGYWHAYNRDNVELVDLREDGIERFTENSVVTATSGEHPIDMLVLATGFDAISGTLLKLNPKGRGGVSLKDRWTERFHNFMGMTIKDFPNLFMIHGPGSPGVFYNLPLGAERQMGWIGEFIQFLEKNGHGAAEPTAEREEARGTEVQGLAHAPLLPKTDSWWTGANVEGKPRYFSAYLGGGIYYMRIADIAARDYDGYTFEPAK